MAIPYFSPFLPLFNNCNDCLSRMVLKQEQSLCFLIFCITQRDPGKVLSQRCTGFTSVQSVPKRTIFLDSAALSPFDEILPGAEPATRLLMTL